MKMERMFIMFQWEQLGYSLDQDTLKSALETLKQERSGTFKLFCITERL